MGHEPEEVVTGWSPETIIGVPRDAPPNGGRTYHNQDVFAAAAARSQAARQWPLNGPPPPAGPRAYDPRAEPVPGGRPQVQDPRIQPIYGTPRQSGQAERPRNPLQTDPRIQPIYGTGELKSPWLSDARIRPVYGPGGGGAAAAGGIPVARPLGGYGSGGAALGYDPAAEPKNAVEQALRDLSETATLLVQTRRELGLAKRAGKRLPEGLRAAYADAKMEFLNAVLSFKDANPRMTREQIRIPRELFLDSEGNLTSAAAAWAKHALLVDVGGQHAGVSGFWIPLIIVIALVGASSGYVVHQLTATQIQTAKNKAALVAAAREACERGDPKVCADLLARLGKKLDTPLIDLGFGSITKFLIAGGLVYVAWRFWPDIKAFGQRMTRRPEERARAARPAAEA